MCSEFKIKSLCYNLRNRYDTNEVIGLLFIYLLCLAAFLAGLMEFISPTFLLGIGKLFSLALIIFGGILLLFVPVGLIIVNWPDKDDVERPRHCD